MTGSQLAKNKHLENVKFIRDKLRVCLSIKENTLPAMTSPNVRKVFSNCSNKNCTYSYTIQMESPPSTSTKTAPSQPSHLPERLYLIPRGIGRETVGFKRRYEGWGGGGAKGKGVQGLRCSKPYRYYFRDMTGVCKSDPIQQQTHPRRLH